jgi:hypothetical protein
MTRNGKIAYLPRTIREELRQRLREGEQGEHPVLWRNDLPQVHGSKNPELAWPRSLPNTGKSK